MVHEIKSIINFHWNILTEVKLSPNLETKRRSENKTEEMIAALYKDFALAADENKYIVLYCTVRVISRGMKSIALHRNPSYTATPCNRYRCFQNLQQCRPIWVPHEPS